ncbi:MAG: nucleoside monophosphate kinase [Patescibacteria group bacterium]|nr:nucleoside monophosphate kinase [Patescibacteria group bacterium]
MIGRRSSNLNQKKGFALQFPNTRFVLLLSATCAGKGFTLNLTEKAVTLLRANGLKVAFISFGQMIRDRMKTDSEFKTLYKPTVERGDLLPDDVCIEMFENRLNQIVIEMGMPHIVFVDGFCRTEIQIEHAIERGYLEDKDSVIILNAAFETCLSRFGHRKKMSPDRLESEVGTFRKRYHLHTDTIPRLRAMFKDCNAHEYEIDADGESIPTDVFPQFIGCVIDAIWLRHRLLQPGLPTHAVD